MTQLFTPAPPQSPAQKIFSFAKTLAVAAFVAFFCIRGFIFEPFKIPSSSMEPTLQVGDYLFVSKFAYGNRIPLTDTFLWQREPSRGDIVVFKRQSDELPGSFFGLGDVLFIKRLVGLPGDRITYRDKTLFINGVAVPEEKVGEYPVSRNAAGVPVIANMMRETLPNGVVHATLDDPTQPFSPDEPGYTVAETTVPDGMYVMMGDNRDNSRDSRFWEWPSWGYVPRKDLMGRAEFVFWSWDEHWKPRFDRLGNSLRAKEAEGENLENGRIMGDARGGEAA